MKSYLMLALALVCVAQVCYGAPTDEVDCSKFDEIVEEHGSAQGLSFTVDKHVRPVTQEELDKRCPEMAESLKTLKRYNQKCTTALTQQVMSAVFKSRTAYNELLCGKGPDVPRRLETIKCLKENQLPQIKAAEEKTILMAQVLHESDIKDEKERLKRACCGVIRNKEELVEAIKPACEKYKDNFGDYIESYTSESMSIICPDAEQMAKSGDCAKLTPLSLEGVKPKYTFFLTPLIKVVKTLDH